jgi:hypothetical protein
MKTTIQRQRARLLGVDASALAHLATRPAAPAPLTLATRANELRTLARPAAGETPALGVAELTRPEVFSLGSASGTMTRMHFSPWPTERTRQLPGVASFKNERPLDLELPIGAPQYVSAGTLKAMLNQRDGVLLKRVSAAKWAVCPDTEQIDLHDTSVEFRVGDIKVYS